MPRYVLLIIVAIVLYAMWSAAGPIAAAITTAIALGACFFGRRLFWRGPV